MGRAGGCLALGSWDRNDGPDRSEQTKNHANSPSQAKIAGRARLLPSRAHRDVRLGRSLALPVRSSWAKSWYPASGTGEGMVSRPFRTLVAPRLWPRMGWQALWTSVHDGVVRSRIHSS